MRAVPIPARRTSCQHCTASKPNLNTPHPPASSRVQGQTQPCPADDPHFAVHCHLQTPHTGAPCRCSYVLSKNVRRTATCPNARMMFRDPIDAVPEARTWLRIRMTTLATLGSFQHLRSSLRRSDCASETLDVGSRVVTVRTNLAIDFICKGARFWSS